MEAADQLTVTDVNVKGLVAKVVVVALCAWDLTNKAEKAKEDF